MTDDKRFILLTVRGQELYIEKGKYFRDKWRAPMFEIQNQTLEYDYLLRLPKFYEFTEWCISCTFIETEKKARFTNSSYIYFHNRDGHPIIRMDSKQYDGPSEFLATIELPTLEQIPLLNDEKFIAHVGRIILKHLFETPMIFEK